MPRPRKPDFSNHAAKIKAVCEKFKYDPFERAVRAAIEEIHIPEGFRGEIPEAMFKRYDYIPNEDGSGKMVLHKEKQADLAIKLMPYVYPQLKSSESREQVDYQISWNIKSFEIKAVQNPEEATKVIEAKTVEVIEDENH